MFWGVDVQENPGGTPEARSHLCVFQASFLMTFAMGRIPHAGSRQPYDPEIPLLRICPEQTIIQKDTGTPLFIAVLFTIYKQPKCPSTDEWIKKLWYNGILLSHTRNEIGSFAEMWMDLESVIQSEVSQKEKKQISYINAYV